MLWYPSRLGRAAKGAGVDVLHCPTMRAPFRSKIPLVVSVHDVAVLSHPEMFNGWTRRYSERALPKVVRAANAIVVGSAFSRDELLDLLPVDESKVRVIPYGVGPPFTPEGPAADGDYLLAVSTLEPRKNFDRLVEGFRRSGLDGLELRVVGAEGWGGVGVDGDRVRHLEGVDDEELARLYRGAVAVVYVSLYEGFGLPVLEAMACGTPVVAPAGRPYDEFSHGHHLRGRPARRRLDRERASSARWPRARSRSACAARPTSPGSAPCESHVDLYRGAGRMTPLDRNRRRRTRPSAHRRRDVRRGAPPRAGLDRARGAARRDHPPPGARPRRDRRLRAPGAEPAPPGWRSGSRAHCGGSAIARPLHLRRAAGLPRARGRHRPRPLVRDGPELMGRRDRLMFRTFVPRSASRADRVLAISERTKRDLIEHYGIPERKIVVTPLGVDPTFRPNGTTPDGPVCALRRRDPAAEGPADGDRGTRARGR